MQKSKSQYESFLFWRQPIPALDLSQLEDLGLTGGPPANSIKGKDKSSSVRNEERASNWIHQKRTCSSSGQNVNNNNNKS
ncbi:protein AF1q isoform X2 [Cyclopterus lumpus]|uniref:protein AF1q isoform X2 n=1 Tax=Cyclopterus lumpus TaxID=8103 RepID=UPI001486ACB7|nr:protein AF1q isoform X2 [Cyclopterus lumpus]